MSTSGWIPEAKLILKSTKKTGDYHGHMNQELFSEWFTAQQLPNIPEHALISMENAAYHTALSAHSVPTAAGRQKKSARWLSKNSIPIRDDCLQAKLEEVLDKLAPAPIYALDDLAKEHGHEILRTPPYHPELQPIETCWAVVKKQIARNKKFTMAHLLEQLDDAF